jgi:RPA family protein
MTGRELAWRVLACELKTSVEEEKGNGPRAPSYLISPLGARMNRVLIAGTIEAPGSAGATTSGGFLRAPLTDPTGSVTVMAGSFQPQARADLQHVTGTTRALVVGKPTLYRPAGGPPTPTIWAEAVHPISDSEYRTVAAETAAQTLDRLDLVLRLRGPKPPTDPELRAAGVSPRWIQGARTSILRYPTLDGSAYYPPLRAVLVAIREPSSQPEPPPSVRRAPDPSPGVTRTVASRSTAPPPVAPPALRALEGRLLEILDELADQSPDGYADMDDLAERAARQGIHSDRMEEILNFLSENRTLEEPLVGKFRRADGPPPG